MDKRTRATIGDVTPSTLAIAQRVLDTRWRKSGLLLLADED